MNSEHKAIRALLTSISPRRAEAYIKAFKLPEMEEQCLILCEVRRFSYPQVCDRLHLSPEAVKRTRQRAFAHIADELNNA